MTIPALEIEHAYRRCEAITREEAANFFYGIRLLPRSKRQAMSAVYAFARRVDDIGDGELDREAKLVALECERRLIADLAAGGPETAEDPVAVGLGHAYRHYGLPLDALEQLVDGVQADVLGTTYESFDELLVYCRQVAGSIGRLCLAIFTGATERDGNGAAALADDLGVAMQLTNIIRDVREDRERGREYLPAEDRAAYPNLKDLLAFEAARARRYYGESAPLVGMVDPRSRKALWALIEIYRRLLEKIEKSGYDVMSRRIRLTTAEKLGVLVEALWKVR